MSSKANKQAAQVEEFGAIIEVAKPTTLIPDLAELMTEHKTKSAVIRHLSGLGKTRSEIAKFMNVRYQHVRNVLTQPVKQATATATA